jgi:DDE family transposase/uncharacterized protein DUF4372
MKIKKRNQRPHDFSVFRQLCNYVPAFLVSRLARETGVEKMCRKFSAWSQVVAMLYAQMTHSIGLNDLCDSLQLHSGPLSAIRGAKAPRRNTLSHANARRDPELAKQLFWAVLEHLGTLKPNFVGTRRKKKLRRFRRAVHAVDSTVIQLVANCMPWAKHRRRKAAAKLHLRLNLQSLLPACAIIKKASEHDNTRAIEVCAGLQDGEIVIFDKAYVWFKHLWQLAQRGVFWVSRPKDNLDYRVKRQRIKKPQGKILRDEEIVLQGPKSKKDYPGTLRRVVALVMVQGKEVEMAFLTNNLEWSPQTIADLYQCRWEIETFFRQIKQTLQLGDFLGNSQNAVRWQIWTALLLYILLRFQAFLSSWDCAFSRLWAVSRSIIWKKINLIDLLRSYGTARVRIRIRACPEWGYLPGFAPNA